MACGTTLRCRSANTHSITAQFTLRGFDNGNLGQSAQSSSSNLVFRIHYSTAECAPASNNQFVAGTADSFRQTTTEEDPGMPNAVEQRVIDVICDDLGVHRANVTEDSRLISDLGLDSVAFAIAIVAIEERFGTHVNESKLRQCNTVADVAALIGPGDEGGDK